MSDLLCYRCGGALDAQTDEWWSHSWREQPSRENVEKAIDAEDNGTEFRDWFQENFVFCPDCHKRLIGFIRSAE